LELAYQSKDDDVIKLKQDLNELKKDLKTLKANHAKEITELKRDFQNEKTILLDDKIKAAELAGRQVTSIRDLLRAMETENESRYTSLRYCMLENELEDQVKTLTTFKSFKVLDIFLESINIKRDNNDPGVCTRLQRKSYVRRRAREQKDTKSYSPRGAKRKLHWKDE